VTRKRIVVESLPGAAKPRDPRFDPAVLSHSAATTKQNPAATNKAYAFLDDYRASEIKQLQEQFAQTKDAAEKADLKRAITSATDRQRALDHKKHKQKVLSDHRKRERQMMRQGQKSRPWFLKKSDLKRELLVKKYDSMGTREKSKALLRRRKKLASKERKDMPWSRRGLEGEGEIAKRGGTGAGAGTKNNNNSGGDNKKTRRN
jgi:ribosomal RNA-processing protein 36